MQNTMSLKVKFLEIERNCRKKDKYFEKKFNEKLCSNLGARWRQTQTFIVLALIIILQHSYYARRSWYSQIIIYYH